MRWIKDYELYLFDFDGLLVNTEEIHYEAYRKMCHQRGFVLPWTFSEYCFFAHYGGTRLRDGIYAALPELQRLEPNWDQLYEEKKAAVVELLSRGAVHLMPGVEGFLKMLFAQKIPLCVVTNSPQEQIEKIKGYNPILNQIEHWFTRETYSRPKPDPECYLNAIRTVRPDARKIIGFEDTPRGLEALLQTPARPIWISQVFYPEIEKFKALGVLHFPTLDALPDNLPA